jgi:hypothetical protein
VPSSTGIRVTRATTSAITCLPCRAATRSIRRGSGYARSRPGRIAGVRCTVDNAAAVAGASCCTTPLVSCAQPITVPSAAEDNAPFRLPHLRVSLERESALPGLQRRFLTPGNCGVHFVAVGLRTRYVAELWIPRPNVTTGSSNDLQGQIVDRFQNDSESKTVSRTMPSTGASDGQKVVYRKPWV